MTPPVRPDSEVTALSRAEEVAFRQWVAQNRITDVDQPDSHYDYRGFWKETGGPRIRFGVDHFPDTYKQHGHPTFSIESKYSKGANDGGRWNGETFIPAAKPDSIPIALFGDEQSGDERARLGENIQNFGRALISGPAALSKLQPDRYRKVRPTKKPL